MDYKTFVDQQVDCIRKTVGDGRAINALSGGVDSSVVTVLGHRALGERLQDGVHRQRADARGRAAAGGRGIRGAGHSGGVGRCRARVPAGARRV